MRTENPRVAGSIPALATISIKYLRSSATKHGCPCDAIVLWVRIAYRSNPCVARRVSSRREVKGRLASAFRGQRQDRRLSFRSPALLMKVLSEHRLQLLEKMCGAGPMSLAFQSPNGVTVGVTAKSTK